MSIEALYTKEEAVTAFCKDRAQQIERQGTNLHKGQAGAHSRECNQRVSAEKDKKGIEVTSRCIQD